MSTDLEYAINVIAWKLRRITMGYVDEDDIRGCAQLAVVMIQDKFDPTRAFSRRQYLCWKGFYKALDLLREEKSVKRVLTKMPTFVSLEGSTAKGELIINILCCKCIDSDTRHDVRTAILKLNFEDKVLILEYYYHGTNMKDIGDILGISESAISIRHTRIMKRLREILGDYEDDLL